MKSDTDSDCHPSAGKLEPISATEDLQPGVEAHAHEWDRSDQSGVQSDEALSPFDRAFPTTLQEVGFLTAVLLGQAFNLTPFGATIYCSALIAERLKVSGNQGQLTWILAAYSLTTGSFVLIGGSLGDTVGLRPIWLISLAWVLAWNFGSGFAQQPLSYDICRGLAGIGAGLMLPVSVGLLGSSYPPGRRRNLVFGCFVRAKTSSYLLLYLSIPTRFTNPKWKRELQGFDIVGCLLGVAGLILFTFAFMRAFIPLFHNVCHVTGAGGITKDTYLQPKPFRQVDLADCVGAIPDRTRAAVCLCVLGRPSSARPVLPFGIWRAPTFGYVILVALLDFMSFAIFIASYTQFLRQFRGANDLIAVASVSPFTFDACLAALLSAFLVSRISAQAIFTIGLGAMIISNVLLATAAPNATYWTSTFFAPAIAAFGPDLTFTAAQIIASNTVSMEQQGVAGSLVGTVLNHGLSFGVALGNIVEQHTNRGGQDTLKGVRSAAYLGTGMAALGLIIVLLFVRLPKDRRGHDDGDVLEETE